MLIHSLIGLMSRYQSYKYRAEFLCQNQKYILERPLILCLQGLYEGLKATRTEDGRVLLFRTKENALRMKMGADRMCMSSPSVEQFVDAVKQTVQANRRWVLNILD